MGLDSSIKGKLTLVHFHLFINRLPTDRLIRAPIDSFMSGHERFAATEDPGKINLVCIIC